MKTKKLIFALSCFFFPCVVIAIDIKNQAITQFLQVPYKINLQTAINLAMQHSYELKAAQANKNSAKDFSESALRAIGPNLSFSGSSVWTNTPSDKNFFQASQQNLSAIGTVTVTQPLLGLVALAHTVKQKELSFHINEILENSSKIQAALLGAQYYLNLQLAMQQLAIAQADLSTLQKSKQDAQSLFETGSIYKDDYLRILLQYTQAQQSLVSAKSAVQVARFALAQALGIGNLESLLVDQQSLSYWEEKKLTVPHLEESKIIALNENQNVKASQENIKLAQLNQTISVDNYLPSVNAVANYSKNLNSSYDVTHPQETINYGIQVTWNVWDWGVRAAQNSSFAEQVAAAQFHAESEKESVLNSVEAQYYMIVNNLSALKTALDSVAAAREAFDLVSFRFLNGQVKALDLVTAQQSLTTSQASLAQARFNLDLAWLTFQTVLGKNPNL